MKIPPITRANVLRAYENTRSIQSAAGSVVPQPDQVELSAGASSFYSAFRSTMNAVENGAGESRVSEVAKRVQEGSYTIPSGEIARKILNGTRLEVNG